MKALLMPLPEHMPAFSELPGFIATPLQKKLVCMDCDYNVALNTNSELTNQTLLPLSKVS